MEQTDGQGGITHWGNLFNSLLHYVAEVVSPCDFDGDDVNDYFLATGATWFVSGPVYQGLRYLNTSTLHADALEGRAIQVRLS